MLVPNQFPKLPADFRLALIGEAPGQDEDAIGQPFVGSSGRLLQDTIGKLGLSWHHCFVGNVCQIRPPNNDIEEFDVMSPERVAGRQAIFADLQQFNPHCICLLGGTALSTFRQNADSIGQFRGSLFLSDLSPVPWKCISTYHPAAVQRQFGLYSIFKMDLNRAKTESKSSELVLPQRTFITRPTLEQVLTYLAECRGKPTAYDIEGYADHIGVTMISFSYDPSHALIIPLWLQGQHYWSESEEVLVWEATSALLADSDTPKICQNALYEWFVLGWRHKVLIANQRDDIMYASWELFPEFPKNLGFQTSIYTREPYYKEDRESEDPERKLVYNGKDSAVTGEICGVVTPRLEAVPASRDHYRFNVSLIEPITYMHLRGCLLSPQAVADELAKTKGELDVLQNEIEVELARPFNVKSTKDKQWLLYDHLGYKPYTRYGKSTAEEVILKYRSKYSEGILTKVFRAVQKRTRISDLGKLTVNDDGRIRSSYNPVGTNTGRITSGESNARVYYHTKTGILKWSGTGTNLQNVTKDIRVCFVPDSDDYYFFQCDLSGADGWTVAADLAALGHGTMLDDYLAGIKPAKVLLVMLDAKTRGEDPGSVNRLPRTTLKELCDQVDPDEEDDSGRPAGWKYLCMKRVQHGTNYDMGPTTLSDTIFKDSEGAIELSEKEAGEYQWLYKLRYNPGARSQYVLSELSSKGYLTAACGVRRKFFDIRNPRNIEPAILRAALSFEPQANTTWATNAALRNLYYDPENRNSQGHLFVEPLLQVHDAVAGQFRKKHRLWVARKMPTWFKNPLKIHGITVDIPYEGKIGPNWKQLKEDL